MCFAIALGCIVGGIAATLDRRAAAAAATASELGWQGEYQGQALGRR